MHICTEWENKRLCASFSKELGEVEKKQRLMCFQGNLLFYWNLCRLNADPTFIDSNHYFDAAAAADNIPVSLA